MSTFKATYTTTPRDKTFGEIAEDVIGRTMLVTRKSTLELFSRIVRRTPVDSGRTRGNWQYASGIIPSGVVDALDKTGQIAISEVTAGIEKWEPEKQIGYIANNVPWINKLEDGGYGDGPLTSGGYSKQAPQGMVKISVMEWESIMMENMG